MREYITGFVVANEVRMKRTQFDGAFLVVEGNTDALVYERFSDYEACRVIDGNGKDNVIEAIAILDADEFVGALGIVDADFWVLEETRSPSANILLTDTHDLETMMLRSSAFDKLIAEFGSRAKIERFRAKVCDDLREVLLEVGQVTGCIRWISLRQSLSLCFEELDYHKFVTRSSLDVDRRKAVQTVLDKSASHGIEPEVILTEIDRMIAEDYDPWQVCCGHDLICVLSLALRHALGSRRAQDVTTESLERSLRLAYETAHFQATQLWRRILEWERRNDGYRICPAPT